MTEQYQTIPWENYEKMFLNGTIRTIEGIYLEPNLIKNSGYSQITTKVPSSIRGKMFTTIYTYTWKDNGDLEVKEDYSLYPKNNIDGIPLLNPCGQSILNLRKEKS